MESITTEQPRRAATALHPGKRVFVVDDHPVMRTGLAALLESDAELVPCGEAADPESAFERIRQQRPDLVLLDLSLGTVTAGLDLIRRLHAEMPDLQILVISMHEEQIYADRVLRAGARGFIGKHESPEALLDAIHTVLRGELALSPDLSRSLVERAVGRADRPRVDDVAQLSDRELEIFSLIGEGVGTREIARRLGVSPKTVETHRERIKVKLGIGSATELVARAVRFRLETRGAG